MCARRSGRLPGKDYSEDNGRVAAGCRTNAKRNFNRLAPELPSYLPSVHSRCIGAFSSRGRGIFERQDNGSNHLNNNPRISRLVRSVHANEDRIVYEFASPASLYITGEQALAYLTATLTKEYQTRLVEPLGQLLKQHLPAHLHEEAAPTVMIDLGPGIPINSLPILKYLTGTHSEFLYVPVDISKVFLTITASFFQDADFETIPVNALFEELPERLSQHDRVPRKHRRVINIGLTFNNFPLPAICGILRSICREGDRIIAASELVGPEFGDDSDALLAPYRTDHAETFNFLPLQALGLRRTDLAYFARTFHHRIEMGFRAVRELTVPSIGRVSRGTEILTSVSYRYTRGELLAGLRKYFSRVRSSTEGHSSVCLLSMM